MATQNKKFTAAGDKKAGDYNENERFDEGTNENTGDNDITPVELELLNVAGINESADDDDELLAEAQLDDSDEDGEKLNEEIDLTGEYLDVPGSETDDDNEDIGEEDEENNSYSASDQDDDIESDL